MKKTKEISGIKGITLIALIITIIVLLILAGVVINMTLGNDGIIGKAQSAVDKYQNTQEQEEDTLNVYSEKISEIANTRNGGNAKSNYIKSVGINTKIKTASRITIEVNVDIDDETKYIGYHCFVTNNSNATDIKGKITKDSTVTFEGLEANTKYKIIVYAYDIYNNYCISEEKIEETSSGELATEWAVGKYYKIGNDLFRTTGTQRLLLKDTYYGAKANWETANANALAYKPELNSKLMTLAQGQNMGNTAIVSGDVWWFEDSYGSSDKCWCAQNGPYMWGWSSRTNTFGVRPCVTLPENAVVDGAGTYSNPYFVLNY